MAQLEKARLAECGGTAALDALVSQTVQSVFKTASERAATRLLFKVDQEEFRTGELPLRAPPDTIQFRFISGETIQVPLINKACNLHDIQKRSYNHKLRRNPVQLFEPGNPEPLDPYDDLREWLPEFPVLDVVIL